LTCAAIGLAQPFLIPLFIFRSELIPMKFFSSLHPKKQRQCQQVSKVTTDRPIRAKEQQDSQARIYRYLLSHLKIEKFLVSILLCGGIIGTVESIVAKPAQAEGSKEMTSASGGYRPWLNSQAGGSTYLGITQQLVANVYVQAGETINVGSSGIGLNGATIILRAPNGTIYTANGATGGIINNRAEELAGPYFPVTNTGGYTPYTKTALAGETGIWQVTYISPGLNANALLTNSTNWTRATHQGTTATNGALVAWDATVRDSLGTSIPGRTYLTNIGATMGGYYPAVLKTNLYVLTQAGYVYQINTSNLAPLQFNFFSNNKGFTSGGNPTYQSLNANPTVGTNVFNPNAADSGTDINNKMFLNDPRTAGLPFTATHPASVSTWLVNTPIDPAVSNFTYTPSSIGGTFAFSSAGAGSYSIELDINGNGSYTDAVDRTIQGLAVANSNSSVWDGKDGAGNLVTVTSNFPARISTRSGEVHFPIADAESNPSGFVINRLNGAGAGDSTIYWDDTSILKPGATKNLTGATSSPSGAHAWGSTNASQASEFGDTVGIDTWAFMRSAFASTSVTPPPPPPTFGSCPAPAYITQGVDINSIKLNSVNLLTGGLTPISSTNFPSGVNAIGFNRLDSYIYGMKGGTNNTVMRIDANGVGYDLGAITGVPTASYTLGDVDANGVLYIKSLTGTTIYGIDVNSTSPNYLKLVKTITGVITGIQDFAFHPSNGKLYTINSTGNVYEISWTGTAASVVASNTNRGKPTVLPSGVYGAIYFASDNSMYGYQNGTSGSNNGAIYRITNVAAPGTPSGSTPVATVLTTTAAGVDFNDGARCPLAPPIFAPNTLDYGDAPDSGGSTGLGSYRTLASNNGPAHELVSGLKLGATVDGDSGLQQNAAANADGTDEDAFTSLPNVPTTGSYNLNNIPVTNTTGGTATLRAWVDFNNNGSFEANEYTSATVANGATTANLSWTVPTGTVAGSTYARFRLTTQALTDNVATTTEDERSFGLAIDGEVEDYQASIIPAITADLTIAKTHAQSFSAGGIGLYQMTVSNIGSAPSAGTITVADTLPAGLSVNSGNAGPVATSGVDAANWTCTSNGASPQVITCQSSAVIPKTVGTSAFQFYVNVSASAVVGTNSITNTVTVAGGGEANISNNNASDPTTVTAAPILSCGPLYGIFGLSTNSLQIYNPAGPSLGTSITTVTGRSVALGISPFVDSNGRRRTYYLNLDAAANTSNLYYYDGITHVNTGIIVPDSPNRMGFSLDGLLYMSSKAATGNQIIYRYDPATNILTGPIAIADNPSNPITLASSSGSGDLAFDANGVMYLVTGNPVAPITEFRLYRIDNATTANPVATLIDTAPTTSTTTSLGFTADGQVYLISNGGRNWRWNLGTGTLTELSTLGSANAGFDLASCAYPTLLPSLIANKTVAKVAGSSGVTVVPGDILEYSIIIRNVGSLISAGTTLQDNIPTGTTYVANSTSMNGTSIADNTGGVMPFVTTRLINGPGQVSGSIIVDGTPAVTNDNESVIKFRVLVNTSNPPTTVSNRATVNYVGGPTGGISTDDPTTPDNDPTDVPVSVVNHPNVLLVKRITAIDGSTLTIGGDNLADYKDTGSPYDDNTITIPNPPTLATDPQPDTDNWPDPTVFLLGGTNGGTIKPNHEMDYTIYFLSAGDQTAKNVVLCDMIPENQAFVPTAFNNVLAGAGGTIGGDRGIIVSSNGISQSYTNLSDGDIAHYYAPGEALPGACRKLPTDPIPSNDYGAIVVNLGNIPAATSPSTPDSYGFVRFRVKVK
jgi:uncharacterized repeat protein (TIGR01451 family)